MTEIQQDKELRTCFSCKNQRKLNEHDLCDDCRNEVRSVSDTWLVQEFSKWYSDDEVAEAIEQIWLALLNDRSGFLEARDKEIERKAEDRVIDLANSACECGKDHFGTPARSVQGGVTTYCQFSRVVPSGEELSS